MKKASDQERVIEGEPHKWDVLLGRGQGNLRHEGNMRLQDAVDYHRAKYSERLLLRNVKTQILYEILEFIKAGGGRFLRYDHEHKWWVEVRGKG